MMAINRGMPIIRKGFMNPATTTKQKMKFMMYQGIKASLTIIVALAGLSSPLKIEAMENPAVTRHSEKVRIAKTRKAINSPVTQLSKTSVSGKGIKTMIAYSGVCIAYMAMSWA